MKNKLFPSVINRIKPQINLEETRVKELNEINAVSKVKNEVQLIKLVRIFA